MYQQTPQASTYDRWQRWAKSLARQYRLVEAAYKNHGEPQKAEKIAAFVQRLSLFIDPAAHAAELAKQNFAVKGTLDSLRLLSLTMLKGMFEQALADMPAISGDMRKIFNSSAYGDCNGREATDIFKGPHSAIGEGIGSGDAEDSGNLAWNLMDLLQEAEYGGDAYLQRGLNQQEAAEAADGYAAQGGPTRGPTHFGRRTTDSGGIE